MNKQRPETQTKSTNQVDDVLQGYLDQLLVTATAPLEKTEPPELSTSATSSQTTAERVAVAELQREAPQMSEVKVERLTEQRTYAPVELERPALKPALTVPEPAVIPVTSEPEVIAAEPEPLETPAVDHATAVEAKQQLQSQQTDALNWRSVQGVECLIFKVAGLKLAIPLSLLGGVHNRDDSSGKSRITPLFGQASWSLGVWQTEEQKLTIIDSAALIMPERGISLQDQGYDFVIQLDRSPWALACQEICETVTLVYDSIKWRGDRSKRPWLAGTVISEMCALVDVPNLMDLLQENVRQ